MTARIACRCTPPNVPPPSRDRATIAQDLFNAGEHLDAIAHRMLAVGDDTGELEDAELVALVTGVYGAARELRMRKHAKHRAWCPD